MKKNVFSRTIAVLASMTVLGAATMISASAAAVQIGSVSIDIEDFRNTEPSSKTGLVEISVPMSVVDITNCKGCEITVTAASPAIKSIKAPKQLVSEGEPATGVYMAFMDGEGWEDGDVFDSLVVSFDPDAEPGEYPITVEVTTLDDNDEPVAEPEGYAGGITITESEPEPTTEAPTTAAPTTAATTVAATTTAKKGTSPKTGSTGVAVAVAGLVTAGATAVVLKKKH